LGHKNPVSTKIIFADGVNTAERLGVWY